MEVFPGLRCLVSAQPQGLILRQGGHVLAHPPGRGDPLIHAALPDHVVATVLRHERGDGGGVKEKLHEREPPVRLVQYKLELAALFRGQILTCRQAHLSGTPANVQCACGAVVEL